MKDNLISIDQQSGREFVHMTQLVSFCAECTFSMKLLEFMSKEIKFSLAELVGQYINMLP